MDVKNKIEGQNLHVYWLSDEGTLYHYIFKPENYRVSYLCKKKSYVIHSNICYTHQPQTYHCYEGDLNEFKMNKLFSFDITDNNDVMEIIRKSYQDKIDKHVHELNKLYAKLNKLGR